MYIGELHDIRLINFSVDIREVEAHVPVPVRVRDFNGRALFSMVDVKLRRMHPSFLPSLFHFNYRHLAFRLLVDDARLNNGVSKGIFFYQSFTDNPLMVTSGRLLTDYRLYLATIRDKGEEVSFIHKGKICTYRMAHVPDTAVHDPELFRTVSMLDRAYSVRGRSVRMTQIQREKWPIQQVECTLVKNSFFETARLEGAFRVFETIHYQWLPPKEITL